MEIKINIQNLGPIDKADIVLKPLTIISGKNNKGKSFTTYSTYGFLKNWRNFISDQLPFGEIISATNKLINEGSTSIDISNIIENIPNYIDNCSKSYSKEINKTFSANENEFKNTKFNVKVGKKDIIDVDSSEEVLFNTRNVSFQINRKKGSNVLNFYIADQGRKNLSSDQNIFILRNYIINIVVKYISKYYLRNPFIITSERTGIQLFQKELDVHKNVLVDNLMRIEGKKSINPFDFIRETTNRYSLPIKDSIDFARDATTQASKSNSMFPVKGKIYGYIEEMLGIKYDIIDGQLLVTIKNGSDVEKTIPYYLTSTSIKAMFDLDMYIKHIASPNDILLIDEPEINLHPENQIKLARLFSKLVNAGVYVFVTTHSDYLLKEINNLIMLSNSFDNKSSIIKKFKYNKDEFLNPDDVSAYIAEDNTLKQIEVTNIGLSRTTFDDAINSISEASEQMYSNIIDLN